MARCKRQSTMQPLLLSIADVAVQLGVCRQTVYSYIYRERLPSIKVRERYARNVTSVPTSAHYVVVKK